ncbi:MAG: hypothetical protein E7631_11210 [Ruminococcaceae bacterium]|nr:hypothetical protein [Oscillospiraceae bacterium]
MAIHIYPVQDSGFRHSGYTVRIQGMPVTPDAARVSAVPYNRRWPGHQRTPDQTELIQFLSLAANEPVSFEITLPEPSASVTVRPHSLGIEPKILPDNRIRFTVSSPAYFTVEPYGRKNALHIFIDPIQAYDAAPGDAHTLYFGPGVHHAGQIELHSGDTLYLAEGAVVYACVHSIDAENIRILGRGILDNSLNKEVLLYETSAENNTSAVDNALRQHTIQLEYCSHVLIDGITIRDSLVYNIRPIGCRDLTIRHVKIIGCWRFNSDGIDMHNCEDVLIEDCFLRTFDDAICVKGFDCYYAGNVDKAVQEAMYRNGQAYDVFRNVQVRRCVIWNDWGKCLEIGAETRAEEISDIFFTDCDIIHTCGPVLDCCNVDYADVHHVIFQNIRIELDEVVPPPRYQYYDDVPYGDVSPGYVPSLIRSDVQFHHEYSAGGTRRGVNRDLLFSDIRITGDVVPVFGFAGYSDEACCKDIEIRNIYRNGRLLTDPAEYSLHLGEHCFRIRYTYTQE